MGDSHGSFIFNPNSRSLFFDLDLLLTRVAPGGPFLDSESPRCPKTSSAGLKGRGVHVQDLQAPTFPTSPCFGKLLVSTRRRAASGED